MKRIEGSAGTVSPSVSPAPARRSPASRLARRHQCAVGRQQDEQVAEGDRGAARGRADAGLPQIRVQDLRHTAATVLLDAGAHLKA